MHRFFPLNLDYLGCNMDSTFLQLSKAHGIATITLNRPEKSNALHAPLIKELLAALAQCAADETRILMIKGEGQHFCAGADIGWMQKMGSVSETENQADAQLLADLLYQLDAYPKPSIILAHGAVRGGGLGLLAAADITLAAADTDFAFSEAKIGMTPSVISPYIIKAMGERQAQYHFLMADIFDAYTAKQNGLIHHIVNKEMLLSEAITLAQNLLHNSPKAMAASKALLRLIRKEKISPELSRMTAAHLASVRSSAEAQEGLQAFLEKRKPSWR
jgi:methylglutaconyl-CoA hydratase